MGTVVKPYTFSTGGTILASEFNSNFDTLYTLVNGNIEAANLASGAVTENKIANGAVTNDKVSASAAIALSKLAALTASRAAVTDATGVLSASSVTSAELGYLSGVTSAIQTQLDEYTEGTLAARPVAGTAGKHYTVTDANTPYLTRDNGTAWEDVERNISARVYNSADISIPNLTPTALTFDSERFDTDTMHDLATSTSRLTATTAGLYLITGGVIWAHDANGTRQISLRVNGTTYIAAQKNNPASSGVYQTVSTLYRLAAGDYVEVMAYQTSGGALNVSVSGNTSPEFSIARIAP